MKIYFAGTPGIASREREREWQKLIRRRLLSFWDIAIETHRAVPQAFKLITGIEDEDLLSRGSGSREPGGL